MDPNLDALSEDQFNSILSGKSFTTAPADPATPPSTPPAAAEPAAAIITPEPAAAATPDPVIPPATTTDPAPTPASEPVSTPVAADYATLTGGKFKSQEELNSYLQEQDKIQQELNKFRTEAASRSPRAQKLYDLVGRLDGEPEDGVERFLRISKLNLDSLPAQQARFEAFLLDPKVMGSGFSNEQLHKVFMDRESRLYGDPENQDTPRSETQLFEEQLATQEAKAFLSKLKDEIKAAEPQPQKTPAELAKEQQEYRNFVQAELIALNKIDFKLSALDADGEKVASDFVLDLDQTLRTSLVEATSDPMGAWDEELLRTGAMNDKGEVDLQKLGRIMTEFKNRNKIYSAIYEQGRKDMLAKMVKTHRNPPTPAAGATPPPTTPAVKKSDNELIAEQVFHVAGAR